MLNIVQVNEGLVEKGGVAPEALESVGKIPRQNGESGRPYIWVPDGSKRLYYSRPSGLGGPLEDKEALMSWSERMVLDGVFRVPALLKRYEDLTRQEGFEVGSSKHKGAVQEIAEEAKRIANAMSKADIGTALHDITEQIDKGFDPGWIPPEFEPVVNAYSEAIRIAKRDHGMEILATELFMVNDDWKVAGTLDKLVLFDGKLKIGDSKTSGTLQYSKGKFCIQVGAYAKGCRYDPRLALAKEDRCGLGVGRAPYHETMPVDLDEGLIFHFSSSGTKCDIVSLPIRHADQGYATLQQVKEWRNFWNRKAQAIEERPIISVDCG